jgi:hypothetical protein
VVWKGEKLEVMRYECVFDELQCDGLLPGVGEGRTLGAPSEQAEWGSVVLLDDHEVEQLGASVVAPAEVGSLLLVGMWRDPVLGYGQVWPL